MSKIGKWVAGIAAAFACASAGAAMHQICYEGPLRVTSGGPGETGIWACTVDGGTCQISTTNTRMHFLSSPAPGMPAGGSSWYYDLDTNAGVQNYTATFQFFDSNNVKIGERQCTISAGYLAAGVYG